jgi:hypothetical protein
MSAWAGMKSSNDPYTLVVPLALRAIGTFEYLTFYRWVAKAKPNLISWLFVDLWVIGWTLLSVAGYLVAAFSLSQTAQIVFVVLGAIRVLEILTFHLGELLGASAHQGILRALRSYRRSLVLLLLNYAEIIFWFAALHLFLHNVGLLDAGYASSWAALKESIGLMVANSSGLLVPKESAIPIAAGTIQSVVGLFVTTVIAARVISLLPTVDTLDPMERNEKPCPEDAGDKAS